MTSPRYCLSCILSTQRANPRHPRQVHACSWILQEPHDGFQDLDRNLRGSPSFTFFLQILLLHPKTTQKVLVRLPWITVKTSKKKHFFSSPEQHFHYLDRISTRFCMVSQGFDLSYLCQTDALSVPT